MRHHLRTKSRPHGFTLIEIIGSLAIIAILLGLGGFTIIAVLNERESKEVVQRLEQISRQAVLRASSLQEQQTVVFTGASVELVGVSNMKLDLGEDGGILIRRAGSDRWVSSKDFRWAFPPRGFCEPLAIRLTSGKTTAEVTFNPLTGAIEGEIIDTNTNR